MDTDAQKIAVKWCLHNTCTSNSELATLSNVCKQWREIATDAIASEAIDVSWGEGSMENNSIAPSTKTSFIRQLMITDMARELVARKQQNEQAKIKGSDADKDLTNKTSSTTIRSQAESNFCLAWFAPSGIQTLSVSLDDDDYDDYDDAEASGGRGRKPVSVNAKSSQKVTCCSEWRGYRLANEVLVPFGYSTNFISVSIILCFLVLICIYVYTFVWASFL